MNDRKPAAPFFRSLMPLLPAALLAFASGCTNFYSKTEGALRTYYVFDDSLPSALEEVFSVCHEPLTFKPGMTELQPKGACAVLDDLESVDAQSLLFAMALRGPIRFGAEIPEVIAESSGTFSDIPRPLHNCTLDYSYKVKLEQFQLHDLVAQWKTVGRKPAFKIEMDGNASQKIGEVILEHEFHCPSAPGESVINALASALIPEKSYDLTLEDLTLDVNIKLSHTESEVLGDLAVQVDIDRITTGNLVMNTIINLDKNLTQIEGDLASALKSALAEVPNEITDVVDEALEDGERICSLNVVSSGLKMVTSKSSCR